MNYFFLCNAIRDLRGKTTDHRSMLVNVNPFTNPQEMVYDLLVTEVFRLQKDIKAYGKKPLEEAIQNHTIASLKQIWDEFDLNNRENQTFEMILPRLSTSVSKIEVTMVNMKTKEKGLDRLDYSKRAKNGYRVIAVGGNSLSRGITLEGLCVSYFYRNTKMYDTLLQMGRWFGYRPGYEDLFKIWMGFEALEWFEFIHKACDDLRSEIAYMNKAEKTPTEFGLKVLNSPDTLMITAANKMRTASDYQQLVSLSGRLVESSWLSRKSNQGNLAMTQHFLRSIHPLKVAKTDRKPERYIGVDHDKVSGFISDFISHPGNLVFDGRQVAGYIQENSSNMQAWTVCVASGSMEERTVAGVRVNPTQRKMLINGDCRSQIT